ncbi:hypothetical protein C9374_000917 [Naegleria lovaniensis]|uniref:Guanylate cyclase domain-containing protein n=1 Tax=Naegleria lovaniensis TaxID=51637 RepID=A0AA88GW10_NAELO|nr:uncharacterized protein C9374_000917 [Naegleria lovaniensis]KAG2388067.1 hypothetical protein C9374_000917 [Naegleria lovaniensis]
MMRVTPLLSASNLLGSTPSIQVIGTASSHSGSHKSFDVLAVPSSRRGSSVYPPSFAGTDSAHPPPSDIHIGHHHGNRIIPTTFIPVTTSSTSNSNDIENDEDLFETGRGWCVDTLCSVSSVFILFTAVNLFITGLLIWVPSMILLSQNIVINMGIISIIVGCSLIILLPVFAIACYFISKKVISKPLRSLVKQVSLMRDLKLDCIEPMKSNLKEFLSLTLILEDYLEFMKEVKSFIPETLIGDTSQEGVNEKEIKAEHKREHELTEMKRKLVTQTSVQSIGSIPSVKSATSGNPAKMVKAVSKLGLPSLPSLGSTANIERKEHRGNTKHHTPQLGLGLQSFISTVIIVQLRNYNGNNYPTVSDLLAVFTMFFQKVQSVSRQFKGRCSIVSPKIVMISFECGKNVEQNALLCALQLQYHIDAVNEQLESQVHLPVLQYGIGVSRSECLVGNIGTSQTKYAACIGNCPSNALRLASLNETFGTTILTDDSLLIALQGFVSRPVHLMPRRSIIQGESLALDDDNAKQTIIQLISEKKVQDDEWFYELQQQEEQNKFEKYCQTFESLKGQVTFSRIDEIQEILYSYLQNNPNDKVISILYSQLGAIKKNSNKDDKYVEEQVREMTIDNCPFVQEVSYESLL